LSVNVAEPRHAAPSPPPENKEPRRRRSGRFDLKYSGYFYIAPFFILFTAFGLFPLIYTARLSLHKWTLTGGDKGFVGLDNYRKLFADDQFWNAMFNTFGLFIVSTVPQLLLALLIASWLNKRLRARTLLRMGILVPNITSVAAVGIIFGLIFAERYGMANWVLQSLHLPVVEWRNHRWSSWTAIAFMVDWRWTGYNALIYLSAMQAIPKDLYESAALDGASAARRFFRIKIRHGGSVVDIPHSMRATGVKQDPLGRRRFSSIDMRDDANVANQVDFMGHDRFSLSIPFA